MIRILATKIDIKDMEKKLETLLRNLDYTNIKLNMGNYYNNKYDVEILISE